jgi:hypothetical protein
VLIEPVELKVSEVGSKSSALDRLCRDPPEPPAIRTRPSASSVAVWPSRATDIEETGLNAPVYWCLATGVVSLVGEDTAAGLDNAEGPLEAEA